MNNDLLEYLISGQGDPNSVNAGYDPILNNLYSNPSQPNDTSILQGSNTKPTAPQIPSEYLDNPFWPSPEKSPISTFLGNPVPDAYAKSPVGQMLGYSIPEPKRITSPTPNGSYSSAPLSGDDAKLKLIQDLYKRRNGGDSEGTFNQAINMARQNEANLKTELDKKNKAMTDKEPLKKVDFMEPYKELNKTLNGTPENPGLLNKIKDNNDFIERSKKEIDTINQEGIDKFENNSNEIDKIENDKIDYFTEEMNKPAEDYSIDSNRLWSNSSTASRILMAIGLAMAARNNEAIKSAVNVIDNEINRDIEQQKYNNAQRKLSKKEKFDKNIQLYDLMLDNTKNNAQADAGSKALAIKKVMDQIDLRSKQTDNAQALFNAQKIQADLLSRQQEYLQKYYELVDKEKTEKINNSFNDSKVIADAKANTVRAVVEKAQAQNQQEIMKERADAIKKNMPKALNATEKQRYDNIMLAKQAVEGMTSAYSRGDNTFRLPGTGDNEFTMYRRMWEDAIGRLQSGGAINADEGVRFRSMVPTFTDAREIQLLKLATMKQVMDDRLKTILGGTSLEQNNLPSSSTDEIKRYD